ncbi:MAG: septum formation initiator family protein [Balneolaceae bacterium]
MPSMDLNRLNPLHWRKSYLIGLFAAFMVIWFLFLDTHSLWTRYQLHRQEVQLREQIDQLKRETEELRVQLEALQNSPDLLERIAREEYGMRREGETVYRVQE